MYILEAFQVALLAIYFAIFAVLSVIGAHRYLLVYLYYKYSDRHPCSPTPTDDIPFVTVQLPIYNEAYVVERLIEATSRMDWPAGRLEIQVLDDSTDETCAIAARCVEKLRGEGHDIHYIHRTNRWGYKAGALDEGLREARGELIAIFDADFVPTPEFLRRTVPHFSNPTIGMVQARWDHINRNFSLLTRVQSMMLDGHFVIEHGARHRSGRFFNFNGTAGIWRRECIISAGGWEHDTLTEDLDLSYRAQMRGWRFIFLPDVTVPAEIPVEVNGFKTQQHRWAKGSIQTARKLLGPILKSSLPSSIKAEACFHLLNNMAYLLMALLAVILFPCIQARFNLGWSRATIMVCDFIVLCCATLSVCAFYIASQRETSPEWRRRIACLPALLSLGIGLSVNNAKAVLEALFKVESPFRRTPKFRIEGRRETWRHKKYRGDRTPLAYLELILGIYFLFTTAFALRQGLYLTVPFLLLFLFGFLYISLLSIFQRPTRAAPPAR